MEKNFPSIVFQSVVWTPVQHSVYSNPVQSGLKTALLLANSVDGTEPGDGNESDCAESDPVRDWE